AFWRRSWDVAFCVSSILSAFLFGVVIGNLIWGVPLGADKEFHGTFWGLLNPYALLTGLTVVAVCMMHGSIYVVMKTQGDFHDRVRDWVRNSIIFFVIMYVTLTMATLLYVPHMVQNFKDYPLLFIIPIANLLLIANIPREIYHKKDFLAFLSSCGAMAILMFLFGFGIFPDLVLSNPHPEFSLNIYQDSSSLATLHIMLIIAMIGMPLVVAYTVSIYWIFRGKVSIDDHSY
ncbi:MAG: cytochrome d ubiquinol oxidase subunit II, partial [Candidatus Omnitrophica bacterium]|nr:cytochrome d ubiquinol oxidase subunit II [Candidatus Omnitrophota bacterium]